MSYILGVKEVFCHLYILVPPRGWFSPFKDKICKDYLFALINKLYRNGGITTTSQIWIGSATFGRATFDRLTFCRHCHVPGIRLGHFYCGQRW
jgi:hypothetical protein